MATMNYCITIGDEKDDRGNRALQELLKSGFWASAKEEPLGGDIVEVSPLDSMTDLPFMQDDRVRFIHIDTTTVRRLLPGDGEIWHISVEGNDNVFCAMTNEGGAEENRVSWETWCESAEKIKGW